VRCGGVDVDPGDVVVADEEGIVVIPCALQEQVLMEARKKLAIEADESLDAWQEAHRARIDKILAENGFED
jgi:4-hydroxy-4-methyl-2-oxoglutarate aldolase